MPEIYIERLTSAQFSLQDPESPVMNKNEILIYDDFLKDQITNVPQKNRNKKNQTSPMSLLKPFKSMHKN